MAYLAYSVYWRNDYGEDQLKIRHSKDSSPVSFHSRASVSTGFACAAFMESELTVNKATISVKNDDIKKGTAVDNTIGEIPKSILYAKLAIHLSIR